MSNANYGDTAQIRLRAIVSVIDEQMVKATPAPALQTAWAELVQLLALGPAPAMRECPNCHNTGMRAASRCGHCWAALALLPALPDATPDAPQPGGS